MSAIHTWHQTRWFCKHARTREARLSTCSRDEGEHTNLWLFRSASGCCADVLVPCDDERVAYINGVPTNVKRGSSLAVGMRGTAPSPIVQVEQAGTL